MGILREILAPYSLAMRETTILNLLLAFALGLVIAVIYRRWIHFVQELSTLEGITGVKLAKR